jgi:cardiolipin synthase C
MQFIILWLLFLVSQTAFAQNSVDLLITRKYAKEARLNMILNETKEIRYNTFIFGMDETAKEILGLLANKAKNGVNVKLILDGYHLGTVARDPFMLQALTDYGVKVKIFNPIDSHPFSINNRNHIKSLIGSEEMIIGGRNTQEYYFKDYIDMEARIKGPEVLAAKEHFDVVFNSPEVKPPKVSTNLLKVVNAKKDLDDWYWRGKETASKAANLRDFSIKVDKLEYHADPPNIKDKRNKGINKEIIKMIDRAENNLDFMNPYVYLSQEEKTALQKAIDRGVKIRINTNSSKVTDSALAGIAWEVKKHELIDMGIEVHESSSYVHAKTIIRDGEEIFIGSFNLDMRSHNLNLENGVFFKSKKLANDLARHQGRIIKTFMKKAEKKIEDKSKKILHKGADCVRNGMHKLITEIVYPLL